MRRFETKADCVVIEQEMQGEDRDVPITLYELLDPARRQHGVSKALIFQIILSPKDPSTTLTWREVHAKVSQAANLYRVVGVTPSDTVAIVLPKLP